MGVRRNHTQLSETSLDELLEHRLLVIMHVRVSTAEKQNKKAQPIPTYSTLQMEMFITSYGVPKVYLVVFSQTGILT